MPKIFIVILNLNGRDYLLKTLRSVFHLNYPDFQTVVIDNNSTDGSFEAAKTALPKAIFIRNQDNLGFSAGNNVGIKYALERGADYIFLISDLIELKNDTLSLLVASMEDDQKIGLASPLILNKKSSDICFSGGKINWLQLKIENIADKISDDYFASHFLFGNALLIRKEIFKKIGLFDEDYFLFLGSVDFSHSAKKAGYKLLVSSKSQAFFSEKNKEQKDYDLYWRTVSSLIFFMKNSHPLLKPWVVLRFFIKRIKNKMSLRSEKTSKKLAIEKAYKDFYYVK